MRIIFNQISTYFELYFSSFLTGFRKNHNTQISLLKILQLWKEAPDKGKPVGAIFLDLSKAFDTLNHDLLTAKLEAYGFSENSLNYLRSRLQRTNNFSLWKYIFSGVSQGSTLVPLMFNIYINDIFVFPDSVCLINYADHIYSTLTEIF